MTQLKIDREKKTAEAELQLLGETSPVQISVAGYAFEKLPDGSGRITLSGLSLSRPWMQELAKQFAEGKTFPVPPEIAGYLSLVL